MSTRLSDTEECICNLEDRIMEIIQSLEQKDKWKKWKQSMRTLGEQVCQHYHDKYSKKKTRREEDQKIFEVILAKKFPNLKNERDAKVQ